MYDIAIRSGFAFLRHAAEGVILENKFTGLLLHYIEQTDALIPINN